MRARAVPGLTAAAAAVVHIGPAGSWLPPLRERFAPRLSSPMRPGEVAVTFDDGPDPVGTPAVLDVLDALGWPATFFVLGSAVQQHPDIAREISRRGHQVAVHGYDHRYLLLRTPRGAYVDLRRARDVVAEALGAAPRWWRPPYGVLTGPALAAASRLGVRPLLWSAWGQEWRAVATPESVVDSLVRGRLDGGTVLLHDSDATSAAGTWQRTASALPLLADALHRRGVLVRPLPPP